MGMSGDSRGAAISGSAEQFGMHRPELPLASLGDCLICGPLPNRPAPNPKQRCQSGIRFNLEGGFHRSFGHVHDR